MDLKLETVDDYETALDEAEEIFDSVKPKDIARLEVLVEGIMAYEEEHYGADFSVLTEEALDEFFEDQEIPEEFRAKFKSLILKN